MTAIPARIVGDDSWRERLGLDDPERCLLAAIIQRALRDYIYGSPRLHADARQYLTGPNFHADCALLGLQPSYVLGLLNRHESAMNNLLNDEETRALHARYMDDEKPVTLEQLARELSTPERRVHAGTLSRIFTRAGLPTRRRGTNVSGATIKGVQLVRPAPPTAAPTPVATQSTASTIPLLSIDDDQPAAAPTLQELNQLLAHLNAAGATLRGAVRLQIDLEIQL